MTFVDGEEIDPDQPIGLPDGLIDQFHELANRASMAEPESVSTFVIINGEIHTVASSALIWENPTEEQLTKRPRGTLLLARPLSGPFQTEASDHYLLEGARAMPLAEAMDLPDGVGSKDINALDGETIGRVVWNLDSAANDFRFELQVAVFTVLLALLLTGGAFGRYLWRTRRMATAQDAALTEE